MDLAANARSLGAHVIEVHSRDGLEQAVKEAKAAPADGGPVVIHVETDPTVYAPDEAWWDVPVSSVSELDSTRAAHHAEYTEHKSRQRPLLAPHHPDLGGDPPVTNAPRPVNLGSAPGLVGGLVPGRPAADAVGRFLDEVAAAGYTRIELGPYGYLPTDPARLQDELAQRGLTMTAGTIFEHLHRPDSWDSTWAGVSAAASLTAAMGARHLVVIPDFWRDPVTGEVLEDAHLTGEQWAPTPGGSTGSPGRYATSSACSSSSTRMPTPTSTPTRTSSGSSRRPTPPGHPVPRHRPHLLLRRRQPEADPGPPGPHRLRAPQAGRPGRGREGPRGGIGFGEAVRMGAMCEPPLGIPEMPPILEALSGLDAELSPSSSRTCTPARRTSRSRSRRTYDYLTTCGGGRLV